MSSLKASPIGTTIVVRGHDHRFGQHYEVEAYLPEPLPREVQLSDATWNHIGDAMAELGRLDAAAERVPNPSLLVRVATRLEAVGTSALEGTYAGITEVFAAEALLEEDEFENEVPARVKEGRCEVRPALLESSRLSNHSAVITNRQSSGGQQTVLVVPERASTVAQETSDHPSLPPPGGLSASPLSLPTS